MNYLLLPIIPKFLYISLVPIISLSLNKPINTYHILEFYETLVVRKGPQAAGGPGLVLESG